MREEWRSAAALSGRSLSEFIREVSANAAEIARARYDGPTGRDRPGTGCMDPSDAKRPGPACTTATGPVSDSVACDQEARDDDEREPYDDGSYDVICDHDDDE